MGLLTTVNLSLRSRKLIHKLDNALPYLELTPWRNQVALDPTKLINWLSQELNVDKTDKAIGKNLFRIEALRASLLEDLLDTFLTDKEKEAKKREPTSWETKILFGFLAVAGTVLAVCDGFDGVVSVLSMFSMLPATVVLGAGMLFSVLSVIVFYGFDFIAISNNLGVQLSQSPRLIDVLLDQVDQIKHLRKEIDKRLTTHDVEELEEYLTIIKMLQTRFAALEDARQSYKNALENTYLNSAKTITAAVAGVLFFASGFFSGQALALAVATLFTAAATAAALPIVATSITAGIGAFSLYWFVERPGLENLIGRWVGLDKEKIDQLSEESVVTKQIKALSNVEQKIQSRVNDRTTIKQLRNEPLQKTVVVNFPLLHAQGEKSTSSQAQNPHRFLGRSRSMENLVAYGENQRLAL